jgi:hypothetical protein
VVKQAFLLSIIISTMPLVTARKRFYLESPTTGNLIHRTPLEFYRFFVTFLMELQQLTTDSI